MGDIATENYIVYCHISPNNKYYIGITSCGLNRRSRFDGSGYKKTPYFWRAIQKYGWDNFEHIIIKDQLTGDEAKRLEMKYIKEYRAKGLKLYNLTDGGEGRRGYKLSEETKKKMSDSKIGKKRLPMPKEQRLRVGVRMIGNKYMLGKKHTQETKDRIGDVSRGIIRGACSVEHKEKLRLAHLGKIVSEETKRKISEATKGRTFSKKTRAKLSKASQGRVFKEEWKEKMGKSVCQYTLTGLFIKGYQTMTQASKETGTDNSGMTKCCKGKANSANGFKWCYIEEGGI